jgi:hypothetical protein
MLREQCYVGMVVEFGRGNGEKTKGTIIAINPKKAKVKTLEARGRSSDAGSVWNVPYSLMTEVKSWNLDWGPVPMVPEEVRRHDPANDPVNHNQFSPLYEDCIMQAIEDVYNRLSPEWLTADGERTTHQIHVMRGNLQNKLSHLFNALGRPVSESVVHQYFEQKRNKAV